MTGKFLDPLILRAYAPGEWVLMTDFRYQAADGTVYAAPKYFVTDLASIPWLAEPFFSASEHRLPGVIHDSFYCLNQLPREKCDALFCEMLLAIGVSKLKARLMYAGVRIGGGPRYDACKGGIRVEDLAFELMSEEETALWKTALARV